MAWCSFKLYVKILKGGCTVAIGILASTPPGVKRSVFGAGVTDPEVFEKAWKKVFGRHK
jgi:hypothetical protein